MSTENVTDVSIPGVDQPIQGTHPLVIIGPNGVGKTQLGASLARVNHGERVAALRNIAVPSIRMTTRQHASQEVQAVLSGLLDAHWAQANELDTVLAEILAEDLEQAVAYRDFDIKHPGAPKDPNLTNTRLLRIVKIWSRHFPGLKIDINYEPKVVRDMPNGGQATYSIAQMSEGERTALYLAVRVVSCKSRILVVDEPETYFHPVLAKNLWDDLEREAPNIRFVYITHDIPFALSRHGARFAIARPDSRADLLPETSAIPADVISEVLGAASFSIAASRLIFCEGQPGSLDLPILRAWHNCLKTAIVPAGGCNAVRECVAVFRAGTITGGLTAFGYIDRDAWPDAHLNADPNVKAHAFSEIEGIFCSESVFLALAKQNRVADPQAAFQAFIIEAKGRFVGAALNKEILQRAKLRVEVEQKSLLNPIRTNPDLTVVQTAFVNASPPGGWPAYMQTVFAEEEARLKASHGGSAENFVRDFPAKSYYKAAAQHLGYMPEKMLETLVLALELTDAEAEHERSLAELRDALVEYLAPRLFPRADSQFGEACTGYGGVLK